MMMQSRANDSRGPHLPKCKGYLDTVLEVLNRHEHPFILISTLAMTWSGVNAMPQDEVDILVRLSDLQAIISDLTATGEWEHCENPERSKPRQHNYPKNSFTSDTWLRTNVQQHPFRYLRIWPEALYQLSVDCAKIEIPDVLNNNYLLVEEDYYRDPHERFGPPRLSTHPKFSIPGLQAKLLCMDIPIFIPTIECHMNAVLDQLRTEKLFGQETGNDPGWHIQHLIRYLFLDWTPNRDWILNTKIYDRNRELMSSRIARFKRKQLILWDTRTRESVFNKMSWELSI